MQQEWLGKVNLFSTLSASQLAEIEAACHRTTYRTGTILFHEKEPGSVFYIILSGSVKIYTSSELGEDKLLSICKPGDSFGELALIDGLPRSASAQALEDAEVLSLSRPKFVQLLQRNFEINLAIMSSLCHIIRVSNEHVKDLTFLGARHRLVKSLIKLANEFGTREKDSITVKMVLNETEVSQMAGVPFHLFRQVISELQEKRMMDYWHGGFSLHLGRLKNL